MNTEPAADTTTPSTAPSHAAPARRRRPGIGGRKLLLAVLGVAVVVVLLFPLYWMVMTSVVPSRQLLTTSPPLVPSPSVASVDAYGAVAEQRPLLLWLFNSTIVTIGSAVIATVASGTAGYSLSRFRTAGQQAMGYTLLFSRMLPGTLIIIPLFVLFTTLGLVNNLWSLVLVNVVAIIPFTTWMMKGFIDGIPPELEEAARVDGCSRISTLWRIVLPLARPGMAATFTYASILAWSDFLFARTLMSNPRGWTVTVGIASFIGQFSVDWSGLMAVSVLSMLPLLLIFIALEPFLVSGMTSGSVKG